MPKLFENLWAKLAALLLAFLLWFHVATDKTYQYETSLKLAQIDLNDEIALDAPPPDEFKVIVSATGKRLLRSDWKNAGLRLVINRSRAGRSKITFSQDNLSLVKSDNIELINIITPREATLDFDRKINKEVPIKSMVTIVPDQGFIISKNDSLDPQMVTLTGPRKLLNVLDSIETVSEYVEGVRNNLSMKVPLVYPDIYGLTMLPDTIDFAVNVTPIKTRVFSETPVKLIIKNRHLLSFGTITTAPERIEIRVGGLPNMIDSLQLENISISVDYDSFNDSGYAPIIIALPNSIRLISQSADSVKIIRE